MFVAPDGNVKEVLCYDYGFRSGFGRLYQGGDGEIPKGFFALARPLAALFLTVKACPACLSPSECGMPVQALGDSTPLGSACGLGEKDICCSPVGDGGGIVW